MKNFSLIISLLFTLFIFSCNENKEPVTEEFKKNTPDFSKGVMTPEILWSLGRIGETELSPDNTKILYKLSYYSIEQNKSKAELYIFDLQSNTTSQLTNNNFNEISPVWRSDNKKINFLAVDENGIMQIWEINPDGSNEKVISHSETDISNFLFSPNNEKLLYTTEVKVKQTPQDIYPDLPNSNVKIYTDLMVRHWDVFEDEYYSHILVANFEITTSKISDAEDIMTKEPYDTPLHPLDGLENITWSPDGKTIAYTCKKLEGKEYATSTNSDIYLYNLETKKTINITLNNLGYDKNPVYSNKGDKIAYESMENDGYEADKIRLMIYDLATGSTSYLTDSLDQNVGQLTWNTDDSKIYFLSPYIGTEHIFSIELKTKKVQQITFGDFDYTSYKIADNFLIATRMSMLVPIDIYKVDLTKGEVNQLTFVNKDILEKIKFPKVEKRWIKTTDNKQMLTWVIYPPDFDSTKKYPTLLYCQGGPQSIVSQFFSYRWNFHIMAANGYIVVAPNRRGLPGFGQEWNAQISKDYGGQNMQDLLSAIDDVKKEKYVDADKLGAVARRMARRPFRAGCHALWRSRAADRRTGGAGAA